MGLCVVQAVLKLIEIFLPHLPKFWDSRCVPLCPDQFGMFEGKSDRHYFVGGGGVFLISELGI